jgi:beta-aspartyl-peptidase (threonine type)
MDGTWALIAHGGCKPVAPDEVEANRRGVSRAVAAGAAVLRAGGSAVDAVEAAVRQLEDDPVFNAGLGSVANADGVVEMDASIMEGAGLAIGAVCALQGIRSPIAVARALLAEEEVLLAGDGALRFARERGFRPEAIPPREAALDAGCDTVGCVALDLNGTVAAATSTGGLKGCRPGRVGDSPLPGAGFYADDRAGAVSATGEGERIARVLLAARVMQALEAGETPPAAAETALAALDRIGGEAGLVCLDRHGRVGFALNATQLAVGWMTAADAAPHAEVAGVGTGAAGQGGRLD